MVAEPFPKQAHVATKAASETIERGTPNVEVLLSTYCGARFLPEQLRSIEAQSLAPKRILVRDDGSDDGTVALLTSAAKDARYRLLPQAHLGTMRSYFELLRSSTANADYVAFADQDDVWKPGKLQRAVSMLMSAGDEHTPMLYCSRAEIVDAQLRPLGLTPPAPYHPSLANALVQNIAMGCTTVINRAARDLICRAVPPAYAYHDWWSYLLVSAFGNVVFDPEPSMLYRQHGGNLVGANTSAFGGTIARARRQLGPRPLSLIKQAGDFLRLYGADLSRGQVEMVRGFVEQHQRSRTERLRYARRMLPYRQSKLDTLAMQALYVLRDDF